MLFQSLINEPVFALPILALISGSPMNSEFIIIVLVFQMMSVFAMQLGRHSPPEFSAGGISAFIAYTNSHSLILAVLIGLIASYLLGYIYVQKAKVISMMGRMRDAVVIILSLLFSFTAYMAVYSFSAIPGIFLHTETGPATKAVIISMPLFYALRKYNRKDFMYIAAGILITGFMIWARHYF